MWGGHYGPDDHERPCCFRRVRATTTKIHDFVSVYVWMVPWKSFLGFVFKIFEKRKKIFWRFWHQRVPPLEKNSKISKNYFLFKKSYFFFLNLHCTCSKHSFEVYNSYVSKNFEFWPIFAYKISIFATVFRQPAWPNLQFIKCCFWCLWTAKDQKNWMEVNFGLYNAY